MFALLSGALYVRTLASFLEQSRQALAGQVPQSVDVARFFTRPLFVGLGVAVLLVLPLVVWRAAAHLRATGDLAASVLGAGATYLAMLLVTTVHVGLLFVYGHPQWQPLVTGYVGLLLMGAAFISVGLLVAHLIGRRLASLVVLEAAGTGIAAATWWSYVSPSAVGPDVRYVSLARHLDDFAKGVLDSSSLTLWVSLTAFALLLTKRSLESRAQT